MYTFFTLPPFPALPPFALTAAMFLICVILTFLFGILLTHLFENCNEMLKILFIFLKFSHRFLFLFVFFLLILFTNKQRYFMYQILFFLDLLWLFLVKYVRLRRSKL